MCRSKNNIFVLTFIFLVGDGFPNPGPTRPSNGSGLFTAPEAWNGLESGLLAIPSAGDIGDEDDELCPLLNPLSVFFVKDFSEVLLMFLLLFFTHFLQIKCLSSIICLMLSNLGRLVASSGRPMLQSSYGEDLSGIWAEAMVHWSFRCPEFKSLH